MGTEQKITCRHFLENLSDYLDGDPDSGLRVDLEAHLAKCPNCWVTLDETKKTVRISRSVECHPLSAEVHDRLMRAIEESWRSE